MQQGLFGLISRFWQVVVHYLCLIYQWYANKPVAEFLDIFFTEHFGTTASEIRFVPFFRIFLSFLLLVCRKNNFWFLFCMKLVPIAVVFLLCENFIFSLPNLVLYDTKHFFSILTDLSNFTQEVTIFPPTKVPLAKVWSETCSYKKNIQKRGSSRLQKFFKIGVIINSQHWQENICVGVSLFNKVTGLKTYNFIKKRPKHRCFAENIAIFLRIAFF